MLSLLVCCASWLIPLQATDLEVLHLPSMPASSHLKETPLLVRPHRRGHVYGNAVRRRSFRGAPHYLFDRQTQTFQVRIPQFDAGIGPRIKADLR
jgi:hypothetical protein